MKERNLAKVVGVILTFFLSVGANAESPAQLPVNAYSKLPKIQKVRLSPDGGRIAYTHNLTMEGGI